MGNFNTVEPRSTDTHLIRKPAVYNGQFRLSRHWKISYDFLWKVTRLLETRICKHSGMSPSMSALESLSTA